VEVRAFNNIFTTFLMLIIYDSIRIQISSYQMIVILTLQLNPLSNLKETKFISAFQV
jgi:hypothetical protein